MHSLLTFDSETLTIRPWPDEVIDRLGFDPRSPYVERFWLGVLGPSTTWLMRRFAADEMISTSVGTPMTSSTTCWNVFVAVSSIGR